MKSHEDSIDAAFTLLTESNTIASGALDFAIVGGWSPYLLCDHGGKHPGTRDVDLLFNVSVSTPQLQGLLESFRDRGFYRSAKHDFQILKPLRIGDSEFIFNVDFLHPKETVDSSTLFIDHVEWPEYSDRAKEKHFKMKSIALPSAQLVFDHDLVVEYELERGGEKHTVRLVDELGLIVTKLKSYRNTKRPRDSYDIYLAATCPRNIEILQARTKDYRRKDDKLDALLVTPEDELAGSTVGGQFNRAVRAFYPEAESPSVQVRSFLEMTAAE